MADEHSLMADRQLVCLLSLDVVLCGVVGGLDAVVLGLAAVAEHDLVDGGLVLSGQHGRVGEVQLETASDNIR